NDSGAVISKHGNIIGCDMNYKVAATLLLTAGALACSARAAIMPSFDLEDSTWNATDIVVATEGDTIDGKMQVLETWKGNLAPGGSIDVPEMEYFVPERTRFIFRWAGS